MPTVGNTAKPTHTQEGWGLNVVNQMAQLITMPAGGPWLITDVGLWVGGWNASPTVRACVWSSGGSLMSESAPFGVTDRGAIAQSASDLYVASVPAVQVSGGAQVYVGFHRHSDHPTQNGRFSSGSHLHDVAGDSPESLAGNTADTAGGIGAYVANYVTANQGPTAPTLTTSGTQHNGRSVLLSWIHNDPDGNPQNNAHVEIWYGGAPIDGWYMNALGHQASQSVWRTLPPGYEANVEYQYRVRTADTLLWGPWSGLQTFRPNTPPNVLTVNSIPTNTLTPTFTGGFFDPDGNSMPSGEVHVQRTSDSAVMWGPGNPGGMNNNGQWSLLYAGSALSYGTQYQVSFRGQDQWGAWGPWTGWNYFTPMQPVAGAPDLSPNTTATRQTTLTPNLTISHGSAFTDHELEIYLPGAVGGLIFGDAPAPYTATTSKIVVPSGLSWGTEYHYRARVLIGGVWSDWSQYAAFKINAQPTAPVIALETTDAQPVPATVNGAGVLVTTDSTPRIKAPFTDADRVPYGDAPSARSYAVRRKDTQASHQTTTAGTTEDWTLTTPLLADVEYEVRAGYRDNAGQPAGTYAFSGWTTIKYSVPPAVGLTAPTEAAVVEESTPLLDWTFTGSASKAQYSFSIRVQDKGPTGDNFANPVQVYDSGERVSADTSFSLPFGILVDGHDYSWTVVVKDTDGLVTELA